MTILTDTLLQLLGILGPIVAFGLILQLISRGTSRAIERAFGYRLWYWSTGWLGAPVHEIGHILFCFIFTHKVTDFSLFRPTQKDGTLGYVDHTYNWKNPWAQVGRLFIGIGPLLLGTFVIFLILFLLLPSSVVSLDEIRQLLLDANGNIAALKAGLADVSWMFVERVFAAGHLLSWEFWVFAYLAVCISSHMELSWADLKGAFFGLLAVTLVLLVLNTVNRLHFDADTGPWVSWVAHYTSWMTAILVVATIVSAAILALSWLVSIVVSVARRGK